MFSFLDPSGTASACRESLDLPPAPTADNSCSSGVIPSCRQRDGRGKKDRTSRIPVLWHAGRDEYGFMSGATDLKEDLVLTFELDLLVV